MKSKISIALAVLAAALLSATVGSARVEAAPGSPRIGVERHPRACSAMKRSSVRIRKTGKCRTVAARLTPGTPPVADAPTAEVVAAPEALPPVAPSAPASSPPVAAPPVSIPSTPAAAPTAPVVFEGTTSGWVAATGSLYLTSAWQNVPGASATITLENPGKMLITTQETLFSLGPNAADVQPAVAVDGVRAPGAPIGSAPVYAVQTTTNVWLVPVGAGTHSVVLQANGLAGSGGLILSQGTGFLWQMID